MQDSLLLEDYVRRNSETAFQSLVDRYLNLVRSTALRQVGNAPLAEEVSQAVFILLARKAARLHQNKNLVLGGWLYRTTRFIAARALRAELRRQRREQEAFQMQQISSTDETWCRIAPLLDEGIEQLDQPGRDAVILRFFQDEPLHAVGGALGISEEAARKRVSRSLEKLRAFFVRRGFTISTAVLATALAGHRAEAAPVGLAKVIKANAMAHAASATATLPALVAETLRAWQWATVKILAGVGAAAATAALLAAHAWTPPPTTTTIPSVRASAQPTASKLAPSVAAVVKTTGAKTPNKSWHFPFQAVDAATGQGVPRARVVVVSFKDMSQATANPQQVDQQTNLRTDAEGRCDIALPYSNPIMLAIGVIADGYAERTFVAGMDHSVPDSYVLKLSPGGKIGGVVQDASGRPVAGAGIRINFNNLSDYSEREFQSERAGILSEDLAVATTDAAGRWTFGSAPTNGGFSIAVAQPGFPPANFQNDDNEISSPDVPTLKLADLHEGKAVLVLKSGLTLRGVVTDEHGYFVPGAKVTSGHFASEGQSVTTEQDGSFVLPALAPGQDFITVTADSYAPQRIEVLLNSNSAPLAVQLKPGAVLRLRVVDAAGAPLRNVLVGLDRWQGPNTLDWRGMTDSQGCLVWNSAPLEPIGFGVLKEGYFNVRKNNFTADGEEHTITLLPQLTVAGHVTDADTKQPIASFKAVPGSERLRTAYGTNGQYVLKFDELSGPLTMRIEADGYEPATSEELDPSATNLTRDFELKKLRAKGTIQGVVVRPDGSAAAGVQVALAAEQPVELGKGRFLGQGDSLSTSTDADGRFSIAAVHAAHAVMAVNAAGFGLAPIGGTNDSVSIQLQPWGRIEGTLRLTTQPNASQQILLSGLPQMGLEDTLRLNFGMFSTKSDEQGRFVIENAPPGEFKLYVVKMGEPYSHETPVQVQPGATVTVDIGGTGSILAGRFVLPNSSRTVDWSKQMLIPTLQTRMPISVGTNGLQRAKRYSRFANSEEGRAWLRSRRDYPLDVQSDGTFIVEGVPPGDYELSGQLSDAKVDLSQGILGRTIASFRQDVTVPPLADGQAGERIDLGAVLLQTENQ